MELIQTKSKRFFDLTKRRFGRLVVKTYAGRSASSGLPYWHCLCDCGVMCVVLAKTLLNGGTKSCGCLHRDMGVRLGRSNRGRITLPSGRYGRLTVLGFDQQKNKKQYVRCRCDCGRKVSVRTDCLKDGNTQSCGCLSAESTGNRARKHGLYKTNAYLCAKAKQRLERKRQLDSEWTPAMELALCAFQPVCVVCGKCYRMATDHVQPLSSGYGLKPGNAVRLCQSCNSSKGPRALDDLHPEVRDAILSAANAFEKHWRKLNEVTNDAL